MFQFWYEPWWDREFLRYQRPRDSQTDGRSYNSQHQPVFLVCLQQRLHHQFSRVSGWWLFPVELSECVWICLHMCVCAAEKKVHACFPAHLQPSRFTTRCHCHCHWLGPCGDPLGCLLCRSFSTFSRPFHHKDSCQTSLWLCMITGCHPPFHPCTTRRVTLELMRSLVVMCRQAAFNHCSTVLWIVKEDKKTKGAQVNRWVKQWRFAE